MQSDKKRIKDILKYIFVYQSKRKGYKTKSIHTIKFQKEIR